MAVRIWTTAPNQVLRSNLPKGGLPYHGGAARRDLEAPAPQKTRGDGVRVHVDCALKGRPLRPEHAALLRKITTKVGLPLRGQAEGRPTTDGVSRYRRTDRGRSLLMVSGGGCCWGRRWD